MENYQKLVVHIPHSSQFIPAEYCSLFYLNRRELAKELLKTTDLYTDELFQSAARTLVFPVTRLVCDVERFRNEQEEAMSQYGLWVCYTKTSSQQKLKQVNAVHKKVILANYYDAHHAIFTHTVEEKLAKCGHCLIVDGHSFPSQSLYYRKMGLENLPEICIGTCHLHTSVRLAKFTQEFFQRKGLQVACNKPYAGAIVPAKFYNKTSAVQSIMVEVNRKLYMQESTGKKLADFNTIKTILAEYLAEVSIV